MLQIATIALLLANVVTGQVNIRRTEAYETSPFSVCLGKVTLQADSGAYLTRCGSCGDGEYSDSATVHATDPVNQAYAQWTIESAGGNSITIRGDNNNYLSRCFNCISGAGEDYQNSGFVHATDPHEPYAKWHYQQLPNGKIVLQADNGEYLARCNNCASGGPEDRAFVHSKSPDDPWAQWTIRCV